MEATPISEPTAGGPDPAQYEWLQPHPDEEGLTRYLRTVRERLWIVIAAVVIALGAAAFYLATTEDVYEAQSDLLLTPVPSASEFLITLGLPSQSTDPLREVQTVAQLVTTNEVATRARRRLDGVPEASGGINSLLVHLSAEPIAESNLVAVTADANDPDDAAAIANAFAAAMIAERTARLLERIDSTLEELQAEAATQVEFPRQIAQLQTLRAQGRDPTLQVATQAQPPGSPSAPRPVLTIAGALVAGLALGMGGAFTRQTLDPLLRRENQLRRLFRLPILGRIPKQRRRGRAHPLSPLALSAPTAEAYRTLRGTLVVSGGSPNRTRRVILVTGSSASEGKTTTAINLAVSFASTGRSVILIEADLRRPAIGSALGVSTKSGMLNVLTESVSLRDALVSANIGGADLELLLADYEGGWISELFTLPATRRMIEEARRLADYVIIDTPPLTDVVDALPLTNYADDILIVARIGTTRLAKLERLGELLAENRTRPAGFAVIGVKQPDRLEYSYYEDSRRAVRGPSTVPRSEGSQPEGGIPDPHRG